MASLHHDMTGKTVMITGFTAGIGHAAAAALAGMGADLVLVCRNEAKGRAVIDALKARHPGASIDMLVGDLGLQEDVRKVADAYNASGRPLDVLFNNAGIVCQRREVTAEGLEATFAVNHLGYFLLTNLLLDSLRAAPNARVVSTASHAHKFGGGAMNFEDLQGESGYSMARAYGQSKLANILFTRELAKREASTGVTANAYHPGFVGSDFAKNNGVLAQVLMTLGRPFARSPAKGADTGVYLCAAPDVAGKTGGYYSNRKKVAPAPFAQSDADASRLWEISEAMTGLAR